MNGDAQTIQLALTAVAAAALALQAIFLVAGLIIARNAVRAMREEMEQYRSTIMPIITKARDITENLAPKIEDAVGEVTAITKSLRAQVEDIKTAADDIIARTQRQTGRLDHMLTAVFDRVERAGEFVTNSVAKPMRQITGILASVRAAVDTLREPGAGRHEAAYPAAHAHYADGEHPGMNPLQTEPIPTPPLPGKGRYVS